MRLPKAPSRSQFSSDDAFWDAMRRWRTTIEEYENRQDAKGVFAILITIIVLNALYLLWLLFAQHLANAPQTLP